VWRGPGILAIRRIIVAKILAMQCWPEKLVAISEAWHRRGHTGSATYKLPRPGHRGTIGPSLGEINGVEAGGGLLSGYAAYLRPSRNDAAGGISAFGAHLEKAIEEKHKENSGSEAGVLYSG